MNAKAWDKLGKLVAKCEAALKDKSRQSEHIWRGEMWAIVGAHHDLKKARELKQRTEAGQ